MIINPDGSINALVWTFKGNRYKFTYRNKNNGKYAINHLEEVESSTGNKRWFQRNEINRFFEGAEIEEYFKP